MKNVPQPNSDSCMARDCRFDKARNSNSAVRRSTGFNDVDLARTITHLSTPFYPRMVASNQDALTSHIASGMPHFLNRTFGSVYPA